MTTDNENPYKVLGVERTADERAIKRAYVALIRKFTPESHPEDFKRIRAAYELLSDATLRARFDDSEKGYDEYGEELSRRLADADAAIEKHNGDLALEILRDVVARFPDATLARSKLAFLHLSEGRNEQALAEFETLAAKEPENARHQQHCALVLGRLERTPQAERRLLEARRLDPKDVGVALHLASFYVAHRRINDAVGVIDAMIPIVPQGSPAHLGLLMKRVDALALANLPDDVSSTIAEVKRIAEASNDPELFPALTSDVAGIAAKLFARKQVDAGNELLRHCKELRPTSTLECPLPTEAVADPEALPEAFRSWLEDAAKSDAPYVLRSPSWALPIVALVAATALAVVGTTFLAEAPGTTRAAAYPSTFIAMLVLVVGFAVAGSWVLRILASPLRSVTTLHPLYLIQATPLRVRIFPLFMLTNVSGTHQHTNGVYTTTSITLTFGGQKPRRVALSIRGQERAQQWMDTLLHVRGRSLELLAEGCLDAEALVDDLPHSMLPTLRAPSLKRGMATALAGAALLAAIATPLLAERRVRVAAEEEFAGAASKGDLFTLQSFVRLHPESPLAKKMVDDRFASILEHVRVHAADAGEAALVRAVEALHAQPGNLDLTVDVAGDAFGAQTKATSIVTTHLTNALRAKGLGPLLGSEPGPRIKVHLTGDAHTRTLALDSGPTPKKPATETAKPIGPSALEAHGAKVSVTIDVPNEPSFSTSVDVPPASRVYAAGDADLRAAAEQELLGRAVQAATDAIGLHGAAVRFQQATRAQ